MNISRAFLKMLAVLAVTIIPFIHAQAENRPSSITFLNTVYSLAWKAGEINDGIALYLPEGESLPGYKDALKVEYMSDRSATDQVRRQMQFLLQNITNSSTEILELTKNENTGEVLLVFVSNLLPVNEKERIVEWSAYRYIPMKTVNEKQEGVRIFGHSRRIYSNDENSITRFLEDVDDKQSAWINAVVTAQIP